MKRSLLALAAAANLFLLAGCAGGLLRDAPPPVSPPQVVEMAKAGEPAPNIIARIQTSGTVYNLTASQFAQLAREGVPDSVLDYMQLTYIREVERNARRDAYHDLWFSGGGWYGYPWLASPRIVYVQVRPKP